MLQNTKGKKNRAVINGILILFVFICGIFCRNDSFVVKEVSSNSIHSECSIRTGIVPVSQILFSNENTLENHFDNGTHVVKKNGGYEKSEIREVVICIIAATVSMFAALFYFCERTTGECVKQRISVIRYIHNNDGHKDSNCFLLI